MQQCYSKWLQIKVCWLKYLSDDVVFIRGSTQMWCFHLPKVGRLNQMIYSCHDFFQLHVVAFPTSAKHICFTLFLSTHVGVVCFCKPQICSNFSSRSIFNFMFRHCASSLVGSGRKSFGLKYLVLLLQTLHVQISVFLIAANYILMSGGFTLTNVRNRVSDCRHAQLRCHCEGCHDIRRIHKNRQKYKHSRKEIPLDEPEISPRVRLTSHQYFAFHYLCFAEM